MEATVIFIVDVPAPVIDVGLKATVTPEGCPEADSVIAESKPPETVLVIVEVPLFPCATETLLGEADSVNDGLGLLLPPVRAVIRPTPFGLPHPVTRS